MEQQTKSRIRRTASWLVVAGLSAGGWVAYSSEPGQRALGRREHFRARPVVEAPTFVSATVSTKYEVIRSEAASTEHIEIVETIDAASQRAQIDTTWVATGFTASGQSILTTGEMPITGAPAPSPATSGASSEVITTDSTYESGASEADPWTRAPRRPGFDELWANPHVIPTYDELVGFELESMPSWDPRSDQAPLDLASQTAEVDGLLDANEGTATPPQSAPERMPTDVPTEVVRLMRWSTDMAGLRRLSPLTLDMMGTIAPDDALVVFTLGFDSAGLARYIDISVSLSGAMAVLDTESLALHWKEWRVLSMSDAPVTIDVPVNVVDAPLA